MQRVVVGSGNPVKVAATERVVGDLFEATVESVAVDSGVPDQPRGHDETVTGAENRARRAYEAARGDGPVAYGVGVEGGVASFDAAPGLSLVMWAAVTDGDRVARGAGPALRLPEGVAERVRDGEELGPLLDELLGTDGIKERAGAVGVFTGGAVDRESALAHAVAGAFGPFATDHYG